MTTICCCFFFFSNFFKAIKSQNSHRKTESSTHGHMKLAFPQYSKYSIFPPNGECYIHIRQYNKDHIYKSQAKHYRQQEYEMAKKNTKNKKDFMQRQRIQMYTIHVYVYIHIYIVAQTTRSILYIKEICDLYTINYTQKNQHEQTIINHKHFDNNISTTVIL